MKIQLQGSASQCDSSQGRIYLHFTWPPQKHILLCCSQPLMPPPEEPQLDIIQILHEFYSALLQEQGWYHSKRKVDVP